MDKAYESRSGGDGEYYVNGPGNGCGYNSGLLWPELRTKDKGVSEIHAKFANIGYEQGYLKAQSDMRKSLGIIE